jgi:membrane protease YdiL (CAAX protease family)
MIRLRKNHNSDEPRHEAFLPILLSALCMLVALMSLIIDRFIFPFGSELLSPAIAQIVILLLPSYLYLLLTKPHKSLFNQMTDIGMGRIKADGVFLIIFATAFMISSSLLLNILFGGVYSAAEGFSILGGFIAGKNEYTVSYPYLIAVYAIIPALCEEFIFRGIIFSELARVNEPFAAVMSSIISACFAFTLGGIPAAILCGVTYCFVLHTTHSLQACMIIHFLFNLFGIFCGTNIYGYFLSSQNNTLLITVLIIAWLISCSLFFGELCKIYRKRSVYISKSEAKTSLPEVKPHKLLEEIRNAVLFKPTFIILLVFVAIYITTMIILFTI